MFGIWKRKLIDLNRTWQYIKHRAGCMQEQLVRLQVLYLVSLAFLLQGCSWVDKVVSPPTLQDQASKVAVDLTSGSSGLELLSFVGGISTLVGIAVLVITRGAMGMRAIIIGIGLVILNFVIANYLSWILVPVLVATGLISLAWGYVTVKQLLNKECNNVSSNK